MLEDLSPLMKENQIAHLADHLTSLSDANGPIEVLEWGSGGSTIYFPRILDRLSKDYRWTAVEHDPEWFQKIQEATASSSRIHVQLFSYGVTDRDRLADVDMTEYITYPRTLGRKFDLILVDGRKRKVCLQVARELVKETGSVYLHDATRHEYFTPGLYPNTLFVDRGLWRGKVQPYTPGAELTARINDVVQCHLVPIGQKIRRATLLKRIPQYTRRYLFGQGKPRSGKAA